jgi:ABC-type sugar transport system ATPase subunit
MYFGDQFPAAKLEERLSALRAHAPMKIGVRPEDIQMTLTSDTGGSDVARVELVEPLGQDTYVYLSLEGAEFIAVARRVHYQDGAHVRISLDPEKLHLLGDD